MGFGTVFSGLIEKIKELPSRLADVVKAHVRIALGAAAGFLLIILLLLVLALASSRSGKSPSVSSGDDAPAVPGVSAGPDPATDEFFLPYEPDFVPGVLLEREPKDGWTEEDARPFWSGPMEGNGEAWRKRIESGIDSLLERVP